MLLVCSLWATVASSVVAAEVQATFSQDTATVGEPLQLQIRIEGGRPSAPPRDIRVDGLEISYAGANQSRQFSFGTGGMRSINEVTYIYQVLPERAGTFTVPALEIDVDGKVERTRPIALRVQSDRGGGVPGGVGRGGQDAPALDKLSFAEIVLPKKTAYVGETIPVEVHLFVDSRVNWQPETMPDLESESFTKAKMPEPRRESARRDGRDYDVVVFRTAVTPSKAGKVKLGPATMQFIAQIPRARPNRPRSLQDFFGQDFFNDPAFGGFGAAEHRKAIAEGVELDVKPLPAAGKPASFSGAVGNFTFKAEGSPNEVKVGDPLTMTLTVSGRGNFDRITAPPLKDSAGWRSYPPSSNFAPEDDLSVRGTKTFEIAAIPETKKTAMPQFEFSYFDPQAEKYVTLTSAAAPLKVTGEAPAPPPPVVSSSKKPAAAATPEPAAPAAPPRPADILGIRYDAGKQAGFSPLYEQRWFWLVQLIPLAILGGIFGRGLWKRNVTAERLNALRRQKQAEMGRLHRERSRVEFLEAAARAIQIETALHTGQDPAAVDAVAASRSRPLDADTRATVEEIFSSRAELLYAGHGQHESGEISAPERERFLAAITRFEKSYVR